MLCSYVRVLEYGSEHIMDVYIYAKKYIESRSAALSAIPPHFLLGTEGSPQDGSLDASLWIAGEHPVCLNNYAAEQAATAQRPPLLSRKMARGVGAMLLAAVAVCLTGVLSSARANVIGIDLGADFMKVSRSST